MRGSGNNIWKKFPIKLYFQVKIKKMDPRQKYLLGNCMTFFAITCMLDPFAKVGHKKCYVKWKRCIITKE